MTLDPLRKWTPEMDDELISLWGKFLPHIVAQKMGLTRQRIATRQNVLGLKNPNPLEVNQPPKELWVDIVTEVAERDGVTASAILAGDTKRHVATARAKAWALLVERYPQYSMAGIGRVSGFDHTTIIAGLRRVEQAGCR